MNVSKYNILTGILKNMGSVLVAFSGGVDSGLLLKAATDALGHKAIAVTAASPARPKKEIDTAKRIAKSLGTKHIIISSNELEEEHVLNNSIERCYYCKKRVFSELLKIANEKKINFVVEGSNADDVNLYRPGERAIEELAIKSPLKEAGLSKDDIRVLAKELGLENWNMPSQSCFLTRFVYDKRIDTEQLEDVQKAEDIISGRGFNDVRVRVYDEYVRVEVSSEQVSELTKDVKEYIIKKLTDLGYKKVEIDPEGYRTGSMDEGMPWIKNK
jgi:uncharacterized protein